ncbi:MAG: hypothetical protein AABY87_08310 [bacterium]
MRPRLTQYLIDKGYVTEAHCSEALQRQVIFGGRIGTNLLELFYVTEEHLLEGLSRTFHVPLAEPVKLREIDPAIIQEIPEDLARKYRVCPFESSKGRIYLAMIDPANMEGINEISFISGKIIKPFVTTESKMSFLLEKYYRIHRERRFVSIPEEEKKRRNEWEEKKKKLQEERAAAQTADKIKAAPAPGKATAAAEVRPQEPVPVPAPRPEPAIDLTTFDGASLGLAQARNREDIANTLLTFANARLERVILFIIKGDQVHAWKAEGKWETPEDLDKIRFPVKDPSVVSTVSESNLPYKGPLIEIPCHKNIFESLGNPYPKEAAAFPMGIRKRVFSVLYGDNAVSGAAFGDHQDLKKIVLKAALSFEILILKAKILFQS